MVASAPQATALRLPRSVQVAPSVSFALVSLAGISQWGFPAAPDRLLLWLGGALACLSAGDLVRLRRLAREWIPFTAIVLAYDLLRGYADYADRVHVLPQVWFSQLVGGGTLPVVWLQERLWHGPAHLAWYDYATWIVYASHFVVTPVLAAVLWVRGAALFRRYATTAVVLALGGLLTYAVFPAAPPWLASDDHVIPHTTRIVDVVAERLPLVDLRPLFEAGRRYANDVAAVPSLHAAYSLLAALFVASLVRRRALRALLLLYPLAMGFALVYSGEHYTLDVLLGWIYAAAAFVAVDRVLRRRRSVSAARGDAGSIEQPA